MTAVTGAWAQAPSGAIDGKFTVNADGDQVYFSKGNLRATYNGSAWSWAFATNQWDIIGNEAANTSIDGDGTISGTGTVDLFGWVGENSAFTGTAIYGITNSTSASQYGNTTSEALKSDWGNTIGTGWRTLTIDEWDYVLNTRTTTSGVSYAKATVNGIVGLILLPDNWSTDYYSLTATNTAGAHYDTNVISSTDWTNSLEAHGAVFLPAGGYRNNGTAVDNSNDQGFYYSATSGSSVATQARRLMFQNMGINLSSGTVRYRGHSVRLVYEAAEASSGGSGDGTYTVNLNDGTENPTTWTGKFGDATQFGALPLEGVTEGQTVTLKYSGTRELKSIKAKKKSATKPVATLTEAPKPWEDCYVGEELLEKRGTAEGGTLMYKVTTTNVKPTSTEGFSTENPKGVENPPSYKNYIWYYIKGDDTHSDSEIFGPIEVSVWAS